MEQLSPLDASFLYAETARAPMHVAALSIYDPSAAPGGRVEFEDIVDTVRRRAGRIDCFHRRLVEVPFGLDHPYWVDDARLRPERHIHQVVLSDPGDWRALCRLVGLLHRRPLRRDRPLWEMHVIEGLERVEGLPRGSFALFVKLHHAAVDGIAGIGVTLALHDVEPAPPKTPTAVWEEEATPSAGELLARTHLKALTRPWRWAAALPRLTPLSTRAVAAGGAPRTRFDQSVTRERVFAASQFTFEAMHRIEAAVAGATVNDVVLAVVGGALRRYLSEKTELPETTLLAMAPVNVRAPSDVGRGGNRLSQMVVPLHSELVDPLERLAAVHAGTEAGKQRARAVDLEAVQQWSELVPAPWAAQATPTPLSLAGGPSLFNTVVSDVPGPRVPLYHCGAELVQVYGVGPVADGAGLFHTALSYRGDLTIATMSCPQMMPDPDAYHACLRSSYEELRDASR